MRRTLMISALIAMVGLAACGDDSTDESDLATDDTTTPEAPADPGSGDGAPVSTATTDLGEVLTDAEGLTLYGFTDDVDGVPTCFDACADAWPPLVVEGGELPEGLDPEIFSLAERSDDGSQQLVAGEWPLYFFSGDAAPGDINGQEVGGVWFAVDPSGGLISDDGAEAPEADTEEPEAEESETEAPAAEDTSGY